MPPEIKMLAGALNLDDPLESLGKAFHRDARNIEFDGTPPNRRVKTKPGNIAVSNALLPATGTNKTICRKYDSITKRIYFFNYNSGGKHGIYFYNTIPGTFQRLIEVGINTIGDPLAFNAESHTNFDIIYGDSVQGDILYWLDSLGRASKINVSRALAGGYGNIQRSFLDVAKEPADIPPYVVYETDATNTVNNLRKKLFKYKVRWVFDDNDKSVTSSQSELPLPLDPFNQTTDADPTLNCRTAIVYQTGPSNVKKIELLAAVSLGNVFSDFFLIQSIEKSVSGIPDNDVATFLFYNNQAYNYIDVQESIQLFDYVPLASRAQTLLNGSVLSYGNITEGYPNLTNFTFSSNTSNLSQSQILFYSGVYFARLIANQGGMSGFGSGNIHIVVRGVVFSLSFSLDTYVVYMTDGTNITYTLNTGDDAAAVIEGLRVNALSKGYTIISAGNNDLYVFKTGISLARARITSDYTYNSLFNNAYMTDDWSSKHGYGLVYLDQKYKTNGVVYTSGFSVTSIAFAEVDPSQPYIPRYLATIYHQPPDWAYYVQWVRTKDLSKSKIQQWITDRTFKDTSAVSGLLKYAYVSIESLNAFVKANPGSPLGYGFSPGDRIKFMKRYNADSTTANLYGDKKDFEIVASLTNPTINGEIKSGQFIKFVLPTTDGSFDFGTTGFANYFIELYTAAQSVAGGLDAYFEYGERYAIGNPTLSNRFHQGMLQNQTADYATPATYEFFKGDDFIKLRSVQAGNVYTYDILNGNMTAGRFLFGLTFVDSTYADAGITAQSVAMANISGNTPSGGITPSSDTRWFLKSIPNNTFRIQGTISINFTTDVPGDVWRIFILNRFNERQYLVNNFSAGTAGVYTFTIDTITTLEDDRIFFIAEGGERPLSVLSNEITFSIDHVISQKMIDQNFSDYFPSAVNSNGRSFIYDQNANQVTYPVMYRWGLAYQTNTNINKTNRFYPANFDEVDRSKGAIMKLGILDRELIFFQERKIGHTGIFQKFITDSGNNTSLITTNDIITSNNVQYYQGDVGCTNQPTCVVQSEYVFYGIDAIKNIIWRLSRDGITDLTELYKVKSWASANLPKYLNPGTYAFGGSQKVLGTFNLRPDNIGEYLLLAQGTSTVAGETFAFEEKYNSFTSKIDIDCDAIVSAENVLYAFKNGVLWKESTANAYAVFFNTQYAASITLVFNDSEPVKKLFNTLGFQSNQSGWAAPTKGDVKTNTVNSQTFLQQESLIMQQDFDVLENPNRFAAFNRNQNSSTDPILSLWEGEYLTGNYIIIRLSITYNGFSYLYAPFVTWQKDPRNF
jgi:hypothetical protein